MSDITKSNKFELHAQATLDRAKTIEEFKQQILLLTNDLGFSDFDYSQVNSTGGIDFTFGSMPQTLLDSYNSAFLYRNDIAIEYVVSNLIPVHVSALYQYIACSPFGFERNHQNLAIRQLLRDYGYQDAYVIPLPIKKLPGKVAFTIMSNRLALDDF